MIKLLRINQLYTRCDTSLFKFRTTASLRTTTKILGQERANKAINTALNIKHSGYNLFVMGNTGTGKYTLLDKLLKEKVKSENNIYDWCYVNNFNDYTSPKVIKLPPGLGIRFKKNMQKLLKVFQEKIPQTFKQKDYLLVKKNLEKKIKYEQDKIFHELKNEARKSDIFINDTTAGVTISPLKEGKTLTSEEFQAMDIYEREKNRE